MTSSELSQDLVLTYDQTAAAIWCPLPRFVTSSCSYRRYLGNQHPNTTRLYIARLEGTGDHAFTALRVIFIPASSTTPLLLDWSNYQDVVARFGIKE